MGDRYPVNFCIGGALSISIAEKLSQQLHKAGMRPSEWPDPFRAMTVDDMVNQAASISQWSQGQDKYLYVRDDEAAWGTVEELETFLAEESIPFVRESEPYYDQGGTTRWHIGDFNKEMPTIEGSEPVVTASALTKTLELLDSGDIFAAHAEIAALIPKIPPLPPFEIVRRVKRRKAT